MPRYKLTLIDQCLPDYFSGYHKTTMQIPVWQDMTKAELMDSIVSEYNMLWDHFVDFGTWPDVTSLEIADMASIFICEKLPFRESDIPTLEEISSEEDECMDSVCIFIACEVR